VTDALIKRMILLVQTEPVGRTLDEALAPHIYVFYAAFLISFIFTPVMRTIAIHYDIMDRPDRLRKTHTEPVAYLGGVAVFLGWLAGLAFSQLHVGTVAQTYYPHVEISIVAAALVIVLLGLWDDIKRLRPSVKIGGQVLAACILMSHQVGTHCLDPVVAPLNDRLAILHWHLIPGNLVTVCSAIVVVFLVVSCCNATNLMDGLDGLCGGVTAVVAGGYLFLAVHLALSGRDPNWDAVRVILALALLGGVLGFIPYNFNPASIFMGDTGSMFLGFACATMILLLAQTQTRWFLAAIVMFSLPVLDTALALARRYVNRRPLFSADRHHFHHQLVARGLSVRKTVLISYSLSIGFTVLGALIVFMRARYAVAIYLVIFGSIIVAAYKMGMVHEKTTVAAPGKVVDGVIEAAEIELNSADVLEISDEPAHDPAAK
jgi:UDP-GlcNAc:undecaprenyl-phosphate/decaprenyl-phosphate GlcNAc-1-phosphate transferase